jgi:SET domain-containing protein|tara:strand:+ start:250 stop:585 length:336 start_codon:yes stop_codon:yes gene_type:complete
MEKDCSTKIYKPLPDSLAIGSSDIHGSGLIAQEDIPAETNMGISHVHDLNFQHDYARTPLGGFINHSEDANCELIEDEDLKYKRVKTIRKVLKGEELTLKYSMYKICDYLE